MGYEQDRGSARQRGYSPRWDRASSAFKQLHPWCLGCRSFGKQSPTAVPDHVVPHKGNLAIFWDVTKWQPACDWHHRFIKPILERMFERGEISEQELWLNSQTAIALSKRRHKPEPIGADGWPLCPPTGSVSTDG